MSPESKERLEKYRFQYDLWVKDQNLNLSGSQKEEILGIIRKEFNPDYHVLLWCGHCVAEMLVYAFREMAKR